MKKRDLIQARRHWCLASMEISTHELQLFMVAIRGHIVYNENEGGNDMGQKDKLIRRIKEMPRDFTFDDAVTLLGYLG